MSQINLSLFPLRYMCPLSKLILLRKRPKGKWKNHLNRRRNAAIPMLSLESPAMGTRSKKMDPASPAMSTRSKRRLSLWSSCIWLGASCDSHVYVNLHVLNFNSMWTYCIQLWQCDLVISVNLHVSIYGDILFMHLSSGYTQWRT